ncbi:uncharacterized protein BO88DRAFT_349798 [Aspergillus vadensis CBS 113365]|uniref:Cell-cycle control medial ring component n=1 Tax=Aspergillus vadensis (strain CBS 113365 / IMI 142717 / IBT 24658) TaxID=1448311 RepID=A0A319AZ00_ASPVC|nr:hypothetical protein BO88DRAFT_349798 [Aspergillus vadensis CBS 113365]PYH65035.1 hypothetical protein BO88DRAFT_349798 [Aspergillus vadensis CBS 113365]
MSEVAFIKSFLSSLDSRPIKLRADYVLDEERVGPRVPYLLPRLSAPHPEMPKKVQRTQAPGSSKSITVHVKSARNPAFEFTLPNAPITTTSVQDLKDAVQERVVDAQDGKVSLEKIKILYKRKPVTGKTIAELLADEPEMLAGGKEVEFGVMIMGGAKVVEGGEGDGNAAAAAAGAAGGAPKAAVGPSGEEVLRTEAFWDDLQGFLEQRLKDSEEARRLRGVFKGAWEKQ